MRSARAGDVGAYQAKPAIYSLVARFGDGLPALTVMIGIHVLDASNRTLLVANVVLAVGWLLASLLVVREQRRAVAAPASQVAA